MTERYLLGVGLVIPFVISVIIWMSILGGHPVDLFFYGIMGFIFFMGSGALYFGIDGEINKKPKTKTFNDGVLGADIL